MRIPQIMVLDRNPDYQGNVLNIDADNGATIVTALEDVTISLLDGNFPSGTLRMKAGQIIIFPDIELLEEGYEG